MNDLPPYINDPDAIVYAAHYNDFDTVVYLINKGIDINTRDEQGRTALYAAVEEELGGMVAFLLERNADVNALDNAGDTPLDIARFYKQESIIALLLKNGATGKDGPSARQALDDSIYRAFDEIDARRRLIDLIKKKNKE